MTALIKFIVQLPWDSVRFVVVVSRPGHALVAENSFLRRQLALYDERCLMPRRVDAAIRASLAFLWKLLDWRSSLVVARPETLIRWRRAGFRVF